MFVKRLVHCMPAYVHVSVITPSDTSILQPSFGDGYEIVPFRYAPRNWQRLAHFPGGIPVALKQNKGMIFLIPMFLISMLWVCIRVARTSDVIHANWSISGAIAGLVGLVLRKPVITTVRGEDIARAERSKMDRYLLNWCLRSNHKIVTVSEAIRSLIVKDFPGYEDKVVFLPNGVESELLSYPPCTPVDQNGASFKLITVGSLIPRKGVEIIIEALTRLEARLDFELMILGGGPEMERLDNLVRRNGLSGKVNFVGYVDPEKVSTYLRSASALVLASYSEGRPNVVLESFAAGLPVIASDIDGVRELVRDEETGLRFRAGDPNDLSLKIEKLARDNDLYIALSRKGREFIRDNGLIWDEVGFRYSELYKEALGL